MSQRKLATKITVLIVTILFVSIIILIGGANWITKNFYHDHLTKEVEGRIVSHAHLLEKDVDEVVIEYIKEIEMGKSSYLLILNREMDVMFKSEDILDSELHHFLGWINDQQTNTWVINEPYIEHVDTIMPYHIPHVWALMPIYENGNGEIDGYIFLDQDTGELNHARIQLIMLLGAMGIITLFVGYLLTIYLTKKISKPLIHISEMTQMIAKGDFDIEISVPGQDEISHLANSIQTMTKQLKEFRDSRRQFISHISHDLRTPITYIKGYSAVMKDSSSIEQEDWKRNLTVIYNEATRMEHLVSDLFLLTKLEEGKIKLELEPIAIEPWLKNLYDSRALMFDQKSINYRLTILNSDKDLVVSLDPYRLEQALINLLENAIRHTPNMGEIELSLVKQGKKIMISVKDSGYGISEKDLPYIWERFYKADSSRNRKNSGTGLGLAIVKEITEAHYGYVSVSSVVGKGSTFTLHLPLDEKS